MADLDFWNAVMETETYKAEHERARVDENDAPDTCNCAVARAAYAHWLSCDKCAGS